MKKNIKMLQLLLIGTILFSGFAVTAHSTIGINYNSDMEGIMDAIGDGLAGGWTYTVENAPEGYEKGFMIIVKENDQYKVQVQIGPGTLLGENVVVKGKEISFDVMVEGSKVSVKLTAKGSAISGTSSSADGTYTINGVKSISTE